MTDDEQHEPDWRIYKLVGGGRTPELVFLQGCDDVSLADSLLYLQRQGTITNTSRVGIMYRPPGEQGVWLANPFA